MTQFDELFSTMGVPTLQGEFGEWVTYYPRQGKPRKVLAIYVDRSPIEDIEKTSDTRVPMIVIQVPNNSQSGISSREIDTGGDMVEVSAQGGYGCDVRTREEEHFQALKGRRRDHSL